MGYYLGREIMHSYLKKSDDKVISGDEEQIIASCAYVCKIPKSELGAFLTGQILVAKVLFGTFAVSAALYVLVRILIR